MLISQSALPVVLFLLNGVSSLDLVRSKRVPADIEEVKTPYPWNHPPSAESYIPVTVIYDDQEDINLLSKSIKEDKSVKEEKKPSESSNSDDTVTSVTQKAIQAKALFANHPPTAEDYNPIVAAKDEESKVNSTITDEHSANEDATISTKVDNISNIANIDITESGVKPKGRSIDIENVTSTKNATRRRSQRRRTNKVKKLLVSRNQAFNDTTDKNAETPSSLVPLAVRQNERAVQQSKVEETTKINDQSSRNTLFPRRAEPRDPIVPIVESENYVFAYNGDFHYSYEGGDGTKAFERGELKTMDDGSSGTGVVGGFSYKDNDGNDFSLTYTADENGYRPVGAHLPTPPPIPPEILQALAILATKTTPEPVTEKVKKFE